MERYETEYYEDIDDCFTEMKERFPLLEVDFSNPIHPHEFIQEKEYMLVTKTKMTIRAGYNEWQYTMNKVIYVDKNDDESYYTFQHPDHYAVFYLIPFDTFERKNILYDFTDDITPFK